ncbi:MAG: hypothetical protein LWX83_01490 [Anaerolineae bacterium]|nr:hypothetical protein [Anaerolineae bacterium]
MIRLEHGRFSANVAHIPGAGTVDDAQLTGGIETIGEGSKAVDGALDGLVERIKTFLCIVYLCIKPAAGVSGKAAGWLLVMFGK